MSQLIDSVFNDLSIYFTFHSLYTWHFFHDRLIILHMYSQTHYKRALEQFKHMTLLEKKRNGHISGRKSNILK